MMWALLDSIAEEAKDIVNSIAQNVPSKVARNSSLTLQVEGPVFLRESLHFDYTEPHPKVVSSLGSNKGNSGS